MSAQLVGQSKYPEVEKFLINYQNEHLSDFDYSKEIIFPHSPEYNMAIVKLVISIGEDIAIVITAGGSETAIKVIDGVVTGSTLASEVILAEENQLQRGGEFVAKEGISIMVGKAGKYVIGQQMPGLKTVMSVKGLYMAGENDRESVIDEINKQKEILNFVAEAGGEIINFKNALQNVDNPVVREEYKKMFASLIQTQAKISTYRQMVLNSHKEPNMWEEFNKSVDKAIANALPFDSYNPTEVNNEELKLKYDDYINGKISRSDFEIYLSANINDRAGAASVKVKPNDVIAKMISPGGTMANSSAPYMKAMALNEDMARYGFNTKVPEKIINSYGELNTKIPPEKRIVDYYDFTSLGLMCPDYDGGKMFAPVFENNSKPSYEQGTYKFKNKINSTYTPPSEENANRITSEYGSIPGGITLEGVGTGIDNIKKVIFNEDRNIFIINDKWIYENPVSPYEMREILRAINKNDKMGVSLGSTSVQIIFGALKEISQVSVNLKLADNFLGDIVFAKGLWLNDYNFANDYFPKENISQTGSSNVAVYFNFYDFVFEKNTSKISLADSNLGITLIPLSKEKAKDGGHLPDMVAIQQGNISNEYRENIEHLSQNIGYYMNEQILRVSLAYGELAAFARTLKKNNINLNTITFSDRMK